MPGALLGDGVSLLGDGVSLLGDLKSVSILHRRGCAWCAAGCGLAGDACASVPASCMARGFLFRVPQPRRRRTKRYRAGQAGGPLGWDPLKLSRESSVSRSRAGGQPVRAVLGALVCSCAAYCGRT